MTALEARIAALRIEWPSGGISRETFTEMADAIEQCEAKLAAAEAERDIAVRYVGNLSAAEAEVARLRDALAALVYDRAADQSVSLSDMRAALAKERERCAKVCEQKVKREAGYHGKWEGYGSHMGDMTGPECAAAIRALGQKEA